MNIGAKVNFIRYLRIDYLYKIHKLKKLSNLFLILQKKFNIYHNLFLIFKIVLLYVILKQL
jgi:hypothetical protein